MLFLYKSIGLSNVILIVFKSELWKVELLGGIIAAYSGLLSKSDVSFDMILFVIFSAKKKYKLDKLWININWN